MSDHLVALGNEVLNPKSRNAVLADAIANAITLWAEVAAPLWSFCLIAVDVRLRAHALEGVKSFV